ncbi:STT3 domain-containing protein [Methanocrinis sp.]|uniref:STT3 domain-containing protein n=1 Tax=Methanocrinis sp. TaxID=3101522 RepID=UPI003D0B7774
MRELGAVFAVSLLGLLLRMAPFRGALLGGHVLFFGSDSFYHMRRVLYTVDHFPSTLWFDSYLDYPEGLELLWPPLFDQLIAGFALLLGAESQREVEIAGAIVPPILGSLTIVALYFLARELFGRRVGLVSALFFAINPQHASTSIFARPDHHVFETFLLVNLVLFLVIAEKRPEKRLWSAAVAGFFVAALGYSWIGAAAYLGAFLVYAAVQTTIDLRRGRSSEDELSIFLVAFGVAVALMLPFWREAWLLPSFFAAAGVLIFVLALLALSRKFRERGLSWTAFPPAVALLGYLLLISACALSSSGVVCHLFDEGLSYFFAGSLSWKVAEAVPLRAAVEPLSVVGFNLTVAVMGFAHLWRTDIDRPQLLFLVWTVLVLALAVFQNRFLYVFSASMSILMALFFFRALAIVGGWEWTRRNRDTSKILPKILLLLLLLPSASSFGGALSVRPAIVEEGWNEPLLWLEENSVETRGFLDPDQTPEYGVLSWWDRGNWILYLSRRPVVANGFQAGAEDAARFFLSGDEGEALEIMDERRSEYVVTDSRMLGPGLSSIALWGGESPSDYVSRTEGAYEHAEKFRRTALARCHLFDCREMGHLRLIYESGAGSSTPANQVKIFQRVGGARISGRATEGPVVATLDLTTNQGRLFQYTRTAVPQDGRYEMVVPYSTEDTASVHAVGPYHLSSGGKIRLLDVGEEGVIGGGEIRIDF